MGVGVILPMPVVELTSETNRQTKNIPSSMNFVQAFGVGNDAVREAFDKPNRIPRQLETFFKRHGRPNATYGVIEPEPDPWKSQVIIVHRLTSVVTGADWLFEVFAAVTLEKVRRSVYVELSGL